LIWWINIVIFVGVPYNLSIIFNLCIYSEVISSTNNHYNYYTR